MTMTLADRPVDDETVGPRADQPQLCTFSAEYKARILAECAVEKGEGCAAAP